LTYFHQLNRFWANFSVHGIQKKKQKILVANDFSATRTSFGKKEEAIFNNNNKKKN
jgi:hypothetical protein